MTEPSATRATDQNAVSIEKLTVAKTARYAITGAAHADAAWLWIVFHGYGQLAADFIAPFASLAAADTRVIAPEGLSRFYTEAPRADGGHLSRIGASWLTRDDREDELRDALAMLHAVVAREHALISASRGEKPRIAVLGFSQGVAMSMRWIADIRENPSISSAHEVSAHVLWAGGLAHDVSDAKMRDVWANTEVHFVVGERDRFAGAAFMSATRSRLSAMNVAVSEHSFVGGHRLDNTLLGRLLASAGR